MGVVMDPIGSINVKKDSTLAMLLAAERRGWSLHYMEPNDLTLRDGVCHAVARDLTVRDDTRDWFTLGDAAELDVASLDVVLMRKDPPFDMEYVFATYILERIEQAGVLVVNKPQSLRDANEKMYTAWFAQCCPPTLVTRTSMRLFEFLAEQHDIIVKPLDGMGGASIFRVTRSDPNVNVIFDSMTRQQTRFIMAQRYLPEIRDGDKRVLLIDGEPVPYALARMPADGDWRGNLAAGAKGVGIELGERERWIAAQVAPVAREKGLLFVGLDVIGDYLTEINVTSPTCIRELDAIYGLDIGSMVMDAIERRLAARRA
ncbi:MAG: glutathione synthase [Gammaproteobacteria bacterium]|nr:glutathione synthase [Gammaproteobacteria bacterium]